MLILIATVSVVVPCVVLAFGIALFLDWRDCRRGMWR